jgi:hypothetical protein
MDESIVVDKHAVQKSNVEYHTLTWHKNVTSFEMNIVLST